MRRQTTSSRVGQGASKDGVIWRHSSTSSPESSLLLSCLPPMSLLLPVPFKASPPFLHVWLYEGPVAMSRETPQVHRPPRPRTAGKSSLGRDGPARGRARTRTS